MIPSQKELRRRLVNSETQLTFQGSPNKARVYVIALLEIARALYAIADAIEESS